MANINILNAEALEASILRREKNSFGDASITKFASTETEFLLPVDLAKFKSTSDAWEDLKLGEPWSVGNVTTLVELKTFAAKEEWEAFYYRSGEERETLISRWDVSSQGTLQNDLLPKYDKDCVYSLNWNLRNLNTQFGRTRERLLQKAELLYNEVKDNGYNLTLEDCFQCVRYRVIGEAWNSVLTREQNTVKTLEAMFPQVEFRKVPGSIEQTYAVDYEAYANGHLKYALLVKPEVFTGNATYILNARQASSRKNHLYQARFGAPVYSIISDYDGNIVSTEVLEKL
jgi:hypothetical protein